VIPIFDSLAAKVATKWVAVWSTALIGLTVTAFAQGPFDTPLLDAAKTGDIAAVQQLLQKGANVEALGQSGVTPLMLASNNGHADVVKLLLGAKANVNAISQDGLTPLYGASQKDGHPDIVKLLLAAGANTEATARNGATPLEVASGDGAAEVVKLLLVCRCRDKTTAIPPVL
jgi:ankyrin repeat protein